MSNQSCQMLSDFQSFYSHVYVGACVMESKFSQSYLHHICTSGDFFLITHEGGSSHCGQYQARVSKPVSTIHPCSLLQFLPRVPFLASLHSRLQPVRWNKPFPPQVMLTYGVYHGNRIDHGFALQTELCGYAFNGLLENIALSVILITASNLGQHLLMAVWWFE